MTDSLDRLEAELATFRPSPLSPGVADAIADELADPPLPFADRCLLAVMSAGSLAACAYTGPDCGTTTGPLLYKPRDTPERVSHIGSA